MNGATIGIDRATTKIVDGEVYALEHDGMLRVKYLYRLPGAVFACVASTETSTRMRITGRSRSETTTSALSAGYSGGRQSATAAPSSNPHPY